MRALSVAVSFVLALASTVVPPVAASAAPLRAFRGAEGFGAIGTTGGRGGKVIIVSTLASTGPGSLQAALDAPGPRIIVFAVSGVIAGDRTIPHGDVTVAGQTAPGAGITIAGRLSAAYDSSVGNIIIRHVRIRPSYDGSAGDQFDGARFSLSSRVLLDHVSVSWGVDECIDMYEAKDVTLSWSIVAEGALSGHPEGQHNYGFIDGPDGARAAVHHNLFVHQKNRNPALATGPAEVRNNVAYNVRHGFIHHNPATGSFNLIGNVYMRGPSSNLIPFYFDDENGGASPTLAYHLSQNLIDDPGDFVGIVDNPWTQPLHSSFDDLYLSGTKYRATAFDFAPAVPGFAAITTTDPATARSDVLARAGAFPRDVVDARLLSEVASRTGAWGAHPPKDLLSGLSPGAPPSDADHDGIADDWEIAHGLDPKSPTDGGTTMTSGYPAIEEYLDDLAEALVAGGDSGSGSSSQASSASASSISSSGTGGSGGASATSSTSSGTGGAGGAGGASATTSTGVGGSGGSGGATTSSTASGASVSAASGVSSTGQGGAAGASGAGGASAGSPPSVASCLCAVTPGAPLPRRVPGLWALVVVTAMGTARHRTRRAAARRRSARRHEAT